MNTDVNFLTMMMDILTGTITSAFADEFSSGAKKTQEAPVPFLHWICTVPIFMFINVN